MCLLILLRLCAVTAAGSGTAHSETQVRGAGSWQDFAEAVGRVRRPGWIHTQTVVSGFVRPTPRAAPLSVSPWVPWVPTALCLFQSPCFPFYCRLLWHLVYFLIFNVDASRIYPVPIFGVANRKKITISPSMGLVVNGRQILLNAFPATIEMILIYIIW